MVSAVLVAVSASDADRTALGMVVAAGFCFLGLLTTRVVPAGPAHPLSPRLEHLFARHAGGLP